MEMTNVIEACNIKKKYKGFQLDVPKCNIPKGFATALIGENGAGKSTFLNILSGIRLDYKGEIKYFDEREQNVDRVKERLGYAGPGNYFLPQWSIAQIEEVSELLFQTFDADRYQKLCQELGIGGGDNRKKVSSLSDGNKMKLTLAAVLSRETQCLLLDEPAAGMNPQETLELADFIHEIRDKYNLTILLIEHHMDLVMNISDRIYVLDFGSMIASGTPAEIQQNEKDENGMWMVLAGATQRQLSVTADDGNIGKEFRCVITDSRGRQAITDTVRLDAKLAILENPNDVSCGEGVQVTMAVKAGVRN